MITLPYIASDRPCHRKIDTSLIDFSKPMQDVLSSLKAAINCFGMAQSVNRSLFGFREDAYPSFVLP